MKIVVICLSLLGAHLSVLGQAWPSQPIKLVVPYPPAGATDILARQLADKLASANGWTFVMDNKPGAGGNIGIDAVAKSKPDGYTLAVGQTSNLAINPTLYPKITYEVGRDLTPIAFIAKQPVIVVVKSDSPFKSLNDLIKAAKASSSGLTMASAAAGTVGHLAGELLAKKAEFKFTHVPYKGAGPALADLLGGQTDFMLPTPQAALPLIQAGKLRALAVTSANRMAVLPNTPTVSESGYPGFEAIDWKVLVGPAKMPLHITQKLHDEVEVALSKPEMKTKLQSEGSALMTGSLEQLSEFLKLEQNRWGSVVKSSGVTAE